MFRVLFAVLRSRIVWVALGAVTAAGVAFVFTVALTAAVMFAFRGDEVDPDGVAELATPLGLLAAATAVAVMGATWRAVRRARARRWMPLYEAMMADVARVPGNCLAEVLTRPDPVAGGYELAADLRTGGQGPLWLPGAVLPRGTIVCFSQTEAGPHVRAWMSRQLWRACAREAARAARRTARAERERHAVTEDRIRKTADEVVAAAVQLLREHHRR